jgi:dihydroorotate dehydrogenase
MYRFFRALFFLLPAETAHHLAMYFLKTGCSVKWIRTGIENKFRYDDARLVKNAFGLSFRNPVGLGAGFDKNAKYLRELDTLGFGFVEIGTVTPKPQPGNDKPRLFRLPKDSALINRMGFNNDGVEAIAERLKEWKQMNQANRNRLIIGGNIGKNKSTPNEEAWKDYATCFLLLHPYVDFFVVNVSSPNTPGLRALQDRDSLHEILTKLQTANQNFPEKKPILLKIAPDLTEEQVNDVIDLVSSIHLDGIVATNTTISRENLISSKKEIEKCGAGGLSGKPLKTRSTEITGLINRRSGGNIFLVGSGGIFTAADAKIKMEAGASLIEVWTGFIYEGPFIVKNILKGLV